MIKAKWLAGAGALLVGAGLPVLVTARAVEAKTVSPLQMILSWGQQGTTDTFMAMIPGSQASLHPVFQFWTNDGHGWQMVQNYSSKWSYQLPASQAAGTLVIAYGLTHAQWQARDYKAAASSMRWADLNASVSLAIPGSPQVGTSYTLIASATSLPHPIYQLWTEQPSGKWISSGRYQSSTKFSWKPTDNGDYHFVVYARDGLLPAYPADEKSSTASASTAGTPSSVLFGSTLPYVPVDGTKTLTATVLNSANHAVTTYSGPVTLSVQATGAFTVKGVTSSIDDSTFTVDAKDGRATFTVTGGSTIGSTGTIAVTSPYATQPVTLTDVSNSTSAQVGYGLFTASDQRISSRNPLLTTSGVPYSDSPLIPVTLKPVNVFGIPVPAGFTDSATLEPYEEQSEASQVDPYYQSSTAQIFGGGSYPGAETELVEVNEGTSTVSLKYHPGAGGLQLLSAVPRPLDISADITSLTSMSGTVLTPIAVSSGKSTVSAIAPNTTYQVTAVPEANGTPIATSAMVNLVVPNIAISSSGPRSTASMVSVPTWNASKGNWTFMYRSGSAANASDILSFNNNLESLTTNSY